MSGQQHHQTRSRSTTPKPPAETAGEAAAASGRSAEPEEGSSGSGSGAAAVPLGATATMEDAEHPRPEGGSVHEAAPGGPHSSSRSRMELPIAARGGSWEDHSRREDHRDLSSAGGAAGPPLFSPPAYKVCVVIAADDVWALSFVVGFGILGSCPRMGAPHSVASLATCGIGRGMLQ